MNSGMRDNRIFPVTRWVLGAVIVVLILAFETLYLDPQHTRQNFAWNIQPPITAVYMGAGYISGAYMFVFAVFGGKWHRVRNSLLPVSTFATAMLVTTLLHLDRFTQNSPAFILWFVIYIITPFLVPWLWYHNLRTDPGTPEPEDKNVPLWTRWLFGLAGAVMLFFWITNFINPNLLISFWVWKLTPLTSRVMSSWGMLLGVGGVVLFFEPRWSAWRYNIQSIALWQVLMILGSLLHRQDFNNGVLLNGYFIATILVLAGLCLLYAWMELIFRRAPRPVQSGSIP